MSRWTSLYRSVISIVPTPSSFSRSISSISPSLSGFISSTRSSSFRSVSSIRTYISRAVSSTTITSLYGCVISMMTTCLSISIYSLRMYRTAPPTMPTIVIDWRTSPVFIIPVDIPFLSSVRPIPLSTEFKFRRGPHLISIRASPRRQSFVRRQK